MGKNRCMKNAVKIDNFSLLKLDNKVTLIWICFNNVVLSSKYNNMINDVKNLGLKQAYQSNEFEQN